MREKWNNLFVKVKSFQTGKGAGPSQHITMNRRQVWLQVIWTGVTSLLLGIIILVVWQSREILISVLKTARYEFFLWMFLIYGFSIGSIAIGWHLIMHHLGSYSDFILNIKIYIYTLASRRLPGTIWYIAGRTILYRRLGVSARISAFASGIEVALSIVSGLMVGAPALFLYLMASPIYLVIFIIVELAGLSLLYPNVLCWLLARYKYQVEPNRLTLGQTLSWLAMYIITWISGGLMMCMVVLALHPLSVFQIPLMISIWALTGVVSFLTLLLPNNLGVPEITLSLLLSQVVPLPIGIAVALLIRVLTTIYDIMWSSLFVFEKNKAILAP